MAIGGSAAFQTGHSVGRNSHQGSAGASAVAAEGVGVAIAGLAAVVQARKDAAAHKAVAQALKDALAKVAPNHPLATNQELRQAIYDEAYDAV